ESTARVTSVISTTSSTSNSGVANHFPPLRTKNFSPLYSRNKRKCRPAKPTILLFSGCTSSFLKNIRIPAYTRNPPSTYRTQEKFECRLLPAKIKHSQSEEHGNPNPAKTENGRLAQPNFVCVPVKNAQIQHNRNEDANVEKEPMERRAHNGAIPPQGLELIPS